MKFKDLNISVTDVDAVKGVITGYLSYWDLVDSDGDYTVKGKTFVKTVAENGPVGTGRIKHLLNHNTTQPVGVFQSLQEDTTGLGYESQLIKNRQGQFIPNAELIIAGFDSGYKFEHSIGYRTIKEQKTTRGNELAEAQLFEGSTLTFYGANPNTPLTGLKSHADVLEMMEALEKMLHTGHWQDATYELIQAKYNQIGQYLKSKTTEPETPTQPDVQQIADAIKNRFTINLRN
ncbi:HK97 family phage prohead protease [Larkinella soli]|uniref:HK97 family phage prohead protease n=1 Tax=Larkinella soli TaxID=1770527 RepID=UPI000FFC3079|nr:HK97 family phage prohead protease [Larkinella soli]